MGVWQRLLRFHSAIKNLGNLTFEIHDLQTETMKKKLNKLVLNDDEQKDINRSLSFMRNNERFSDLRFICNDKTIVNAHSEIFRQASPFMATLFKIAKEKQPYENVFVSMAETESKVITKLVQAMYLGQTTVTKKEESELQTVIKLLGMKMPLNSKEDTETEEESEQEVVKDSTTAKAKSKDKANVFSDEDEIPQGKKSAKSGHKDEEKLRKEAEKDIVKPKICPVEAINDAEVKKLYRNSISEAEKSDKSRDPSPAMSPTRAKRKPGPKSKPKSKKQAEKDVIKPKISRLEESDDEKSVKSTKSEKSGVSRDSSPVSVAASTPSAKRKPAGRTPKPKSAQATKKKPFTTNNANNDDSEKEGDKDVVKPKISRLDDSDDDNSVKSGKSDTSRDSSPVSVAASTASTKRKPAARTPKPKPGTAAKKKASQNDDEKLKKEAEKDVVKPKICRLEESDEADVKKYFKKENKTKPAIPPTITPKLVANPFSKAPVAAAASASGTEETNGQKLAPNPFAKDKKKPIEAPDTNDADADTAPNTSIQKMASNPFFKGAAAATTTPQTKSTPQKRRLADSDKKVVNKASKKARQESSTSGDDSALEEAKNQRSKEIPASAKARARKSSESSSVEDAKVRKSNIKPASDSKKSGNSRDSSPAVAESTTKRKPGPKSKPKIGPAASKKGTETKSAVNTMAFSEGDSITCCEDCDKIFISKQAYLNHKKDVHETKRASESEKSDSSDDNSEPVKKTPSKPGPRTKKSKAKISEERRKSIGHHQAPQMMMNPHLTSQKVRDVQDQNQNCQKMTQYPTRRKLPKLDLPQK